jgi:transcriptional regulator with XRE-family HTH domain
MGILDRVKKLCAENSISVGDLEKELEFSNGSIYKWIKTTPGADKVEKVADYFNVSVDYLLGKTAFRNPMEMFEHWSGNNDIYFESPFDFGGLLKKIREAQGISQKEVSEALCITISDVEDIEDGVLPLNFDWAEKFAKLLGTSVTEIFIENGMSDSLNDIPLELLHHYRNLGMSEKEMVTAYTTYKNGIYNDNLEKNTDTEIHTLAAHKDGIEWTEEELEDIENFKEYVLSKRKNKE